MIFIDAREGLSGDMLLAAMLGLLEEDAKKRSVKRIAAAASNLGLEFQLIELEDSGETGLGISCLGAEPLRHGISYEECFAQLARIEKGLGSRSDLGRAILESIFVAEEKAHGVPKKEVHLHEIGRPQALLNMAGIGLVSSELLEAGAEGFVCTTITTGSGTVVTSHGPTRVPAPAAAILLEGLRHVPGPVPGERATPTGIAAAKALITHQSDDFPVVFVKKSVGFGTKRFAGRLGRTTVAWT